MKLEFKEDGILGVFGENIEAEKYVLINEEIKTYILTKSVRLKQESCIVGKEVGIEDFEEYKSEEVFHIPTLEERVAALEELMMERLENY